MSNEEMNIEEVELKISNYLILFEGKELTRRQTISKITHIELSKGKVHYATFVGSRVVVCNNPDCQNCHGSGKLPPVTIEDVIKEKLG